MHTQKFQVFMLLLLVVTVFYKPQSKESEDDGFPTHGQRYNTPIAANGTIEHQTIDGKDVQKVTIPENITKPQQQQHKFEEKIHPTAEVKEEHTEEPTKPENLEKPTQAEKEIEKKVEDVPQTPQQVVNETTPQPEKTPEATEKPSETKEMEKEPVNIESDTNETGKKTDEEFTTTPESQQGAENLTNESKVEETPKKEEHPKPTVPEETPAPAPVETSNDTNKTNTPDLNLTEDEEEEYEEEEEDEEEEEQIEQKEQKAPEVPPQTAPVEKANETLSTNESIPTGQNLKEQVEEEEEEEKEEGTERQDQPQPKFPSQIPPDEGANETALPTTQMKSTNETTIKANETATEQNLSQNETQPVVGEEEEEEYEEEEEELPETPASLNTTEAKTNETTVSNKTAPAQNISETQEQAPLDGEEEEEYEEEEGEYVDEPLNETVATANETKTTVEETPVQNVSSTETKKTEEQKQVAPKPKTSHVYRFFKDDYSVEEIPSNDVFYILKELNHWHAEETKNHTASKKDFGNLGANAVRTWKRQDEENKRKEQHRILQDTVLIPLHQKRYTSNIPNRKNKTLAKIKALFTRNGKPCTIDPVFIPKGMTRLEVEENKVPFGGIAALVSLIAVLLFASSSKKDPSEQIIISSKDLKADKDYQDLQKNLTDLRGATTMIRTMVDTKGNGYQPNQRNNLVKKIDSLEQDINTFEKSCVEFATEISAQQKILFKELDNFYES